MSSVSEDVRDFDERMPYPAPLTSLHEERNLYGNPARRLALFHRSWPTAKLRQNLEILIAGCGTSQAASHALREPEARVTAIDISGTSLGHTRDLQGKYNLGNLELHQLPIERVGELGRCFDLIVCTGVLHHLPEPDVGLRALRDVLRPDGAMHLMVYARHGRTVKDDLVVVPEPFEEAKGARPRFETLATSVVWLYPPRRLSCDTACSSPPSEEACACGTA